jgi:hypothetical protein
VLDAGPALLSRDPDAGVRKVVAAHPNLPGPDLVRLLDDPSESVAATVAASPALPAAEMERILTLAGV